LVPHALSAVRSSPVVELNRATAVSMANGTEAGLHIVEKLAVVPAMTPNERERALLLERASSCVD
jgi:predicted RNA polymerase sigma factor